MGFLKQLLVTMVEEEFDEDFLDGIDVDKIVDDYLAEQEII